MRDDHGDMLHDLDGFVSEFTAEAQSVAIAAHDLAGLGRLSARIARDLRGWIEAIGDLHCGRPPDPRRAGLLVRETVLDESLTPAACRVVAAISAIEAGRWDRPLERSGTQTPASARPV